MVTIIWMFQVKPGKEPEFEQAYGSTGDWTKLFRRGEGYLGSELLRDRTNLGRYLTIDRWVSVAAHEAFQKRWRDEYEALDRQLEQLAERETKLGEFEVAQADTL